MIQPRIPDAVNKYAANYNGTISMDNIVIASGDRVKVLSVSQELFAYTTNSYYGTSALSGYKGRTGAFVGDYERYGRETPKRRHLLQNITVPQFSEVKRFLQ